MPAQHLISLVSLSIHHTQSEDRKRSGPVGKITFWNRKNSLRPFSSVIVDGFYVVSAEGKPTFWVLDVLHADVPMYRRPLLERLRCIQNDLTKPRIQA